MPLYEYHCSKCGKTFERIRKFSDPPLTIHDDDCGGVLERLPSAPSFRLTGSGWYATDYAKTGAKPDSEGKKSGEGKSESKASESASGESKTSDSKTSESQSGDSKSGESKSDSKTTESKSSETKPASTSSKSD